MRTIIIADDLTGACDTAIAIKRKNERACICLQEVPENDIQAGTDILAFSTDSRAASGQDAYHTVAHLAASLRDRLNGPFRVYKKIDSLFRGNVGAEIEAVARAYERDFVLLAPAAPAHGRVVRGGHLYVTPVPLKEEGMDLAPFLEWPDAPPFVSVKLHQVRRGTAALAEHLRGLRREGVSRVLMDSESERDLHIIAQAVQNLGADIILAGSSGFAGALNQELGAGYLPRPIPKREPPVLFVLGSCSDVTRSQCEHMVAYPGMSVVWISAENCIKGKKEQEIDRAYQHCEAILKEEPMALILAVDSLQEGAADCAEVRKNREISGRQIVDALGQVVNRLIGCYPFDILLLSGGDTARETLRDIGAESMEVFYELLPGVPLARVRNCTGKELLVITKSGSFGETETFSKIFEIMTGRMITEEAI